MPTYSYRCTVCGDAFDVHQAFTDSSLTQCPSCDGPLRKLFSAVGITFNGSGFYRTDSRAQQSASSPSSSSSPAASEAKSPPAAQPAAAASASNNGSGSATS
ncbi:hypothetical protein GCM10027416_09620 [Okibacterium endophyticum]